jgi:hypothetical protein
MLTIGYDVLIFTLNVLLLYILQGSYQFPSTQLFTFFQTSYTAACFNQVVAIVI